MHKIRIEKFGPVQKCEFTVENFCVLSGEQASGKSTIAKAVFFFRTIKEDIYTIFLREYASAGKEKQFRVLLEKKIRSKFLQTFGSSWSMDMDMSLVYYFDQNTWARITLAESEFKDEPNFIFSEFSSNIYDYLKKLEQYDIRDQEEIKIVRAQINRLFCDEFETIFVPAGREMITLLTNQLNYIFTIMDDSQKRSIDYCTQSYIEQILKIKPLFENGMQGMYQNKLLTSEESVNKKILKQIMKLTDHILKGKYMFVSGEERLVLDNHKYVKMNYTSSGQQESVWILNLIFYFVLENRKTYLILEEPESHLYPEAQKHMAELIGLFLNASNGGIVTTHSPYLLGAFNNLLYASFLGAKNPTDTEKIIDRDRWIDIEQTSGLYVERGRVLDMIDEELPMMKNEVIDKISEIINRDNELLMQIHFTQEQGNVK
ncbi:MAG: ATP-binding protein [Clostridiaceae bacterium]|nr:ATP-binding protein [Clostridiaceae bacterium]